MRNMNSRVNESLRMGSWGRIHNTSFSLQLTNGPSKLECYIRLGLKDLPMTNTQAYWGQVTKKMKGCEYGH
jgi:hypothetical protein